MPILGLSLFRFVRLSQREGLGADGIMAKEKLVYWNPHNKCESSASKLSASRFTSSAGTKGI